MVAARARCPVFLDREWTHGVQGLSVPGLGGKEWATGRRAGLVGFPVRVAEFLWRGARGAFQRQSRVRSVPGADTLRRLEEEQREFAAFLERLRFAKDKSEFDEFMNQRRQRPEPPAETPPAN